MESPEKRKKLKKSRTSFLVNLNSDEAVSSLTAKHTKRYLASRYSILNIKFSDLGKSAEQLDRDVDEGEVLSESESEANPFGSVAKYNRLGWRIDAKNEDNVGASEDKSFKFDASDIRKLALEGPLLSKLKDLDESNKHLFYNKIWHRDHQESLTLNSRDKLSRAGAAVANKMRALEMFDRHILARKSLSDRWSTLPKVFEENAFTPLRQVSLSRPSSKESSPTKTNESSPTKSDITPSSGSPDDRGGAPAQEDDNLNIFEPSMRTSFVDNQLSSFESDTFFLSFEDQDVRSLGNKAVTEAESKKSKEAVAVNCQDEPKRNEGEEKQAVVDAPPATLAQPIIQIEAEPITLVQRDNSSNDGSSTLAASVNNSSSKKGEAPSVQVQLEAPEAPEVRVIQLDESLDISSQFEALQTEFEYQMEQEQRAQAAAAEARDALGVITISFKPADIFTSFETQPTLLEPQVPVPAKPDRPVSTDLNGFLYEQNGADQSSLPVICRQESICLSKLTQKHVSDFVLPASSTNQPYKFKKIDSNEKDDFAFVEQISGAYDSDVSLD